MHTYTAETNCCRSISLKYCKERLRVRYTNIVTSCSASNLKMNKSGTSGGDHLIKSSS